MTISTSASSLHDLNNETLSSDSADQPLFRASPRPSLDVDDKPFLPLSPPPELKPSEILQNKKSKSNDGSNNNNSNNNSISSNNSHRKSHNDNNSNTPSVNNNDAPPLFPLSPPPPLSLGDIKQNSAANDAAKSKKYQRTKDMMEGILNNNISSLQKRKSEGVPVDRRRVSMGVFEERKIRAKSCNSEQSSNRRPLSEGSTEEECIRHCFSSNQENSEQSEQEKLLKNIKKRRRSSSKSSSGEQKNNAETENITEKTTSVVDNNCTTTSFSTTSITEELFQSKNTQVGLEKCIAGLEISLKYKDPHCEAANVFQNRRGHAIRRKRTSIVPGN